MSDLYLLIGGNQGDRLQLIQSATDLIQQRVGSVAHFSPIYETEPWGTFAEGEKVQGFLNQALEVRTSLSPLEALRECLSIEAELGRKRNLGGTTSKKRIYSSRPIDIDLILYGQEVVNTPELTLPHPRMHLRRFVLQPLSDIAPNIIHPIYNKSIIQLLAICPDTSSCYCL
ncbi:MAG: 2-amino-4-hydroxy-6-hydroxymethyldihydropteridine diphosphokinase [Bacteroidales bacterium]|nr:2-amino-4-hydroxy-6-hydroxymethyldihydropteridine diphosphokinase [Bacteroidales bacterium]